MNLHTIDIKTITLTYLLKLMYATGFGDGQLAHRQACSTKRSRRAHLPSRLAYSGGHVRASKLAPSTPFRRYGGCPQMDGRKISAMCPVILRHVSNETQKTNPCDLHGQGTGYWPSACHGTTARAAVCPIGLGFPSDSFRFLCGVELPSVAIYTCRSAARRCVCC